MTTTAAGESASTILEDEELPRHRGRLRIWIGIVCLVCLVIAAVGSLFFGHLAYDQELTERLLPPSGSHLMGTDTLGRDVVARVLAGLLVSLRIALVAVVIGCVFGVLVGAISGYFGGWIDTILMRITDAVLAVPLVLLAISVIAVLGGGLLNLIIVIAVTQWMVYARTARGEIQSLREETFVTAARSLGATDGRIIVKHCLPQMIPTIIVLATLGISEAILLEAGLSFLGLGIQPPEPSLGMMLSEGRQFIERAPWLALWPGVMIFAVVFGINSLGDGIRAWMDRNK